jgi:SAM-dependent methyltransferase
VKKYFEYAFNSEIKQKLLIYYEDTNLGQHNANHMNKAELKLNRINKMISLSKRDVVLDVGCSKGFLLKKISSKINKGIGIDISENIIKLNNKNNTLKNISYAHFDGKHISSKEKFSKIFMLDVLEHAFNPDILVKNIHSHLKPDGALIVEVPFTGWLSELIAGKYHAGHLRYYDPSYLSKYFEKNGFLVKKIKVYNSVPFSSFFIKFKTVFRALDFIVNIVPSKFYPYFGEVIIICEKK